MVQKFPQRKHPRLDDFDYSSNGAYFVTLCIENRKCILFHIVGRGFTPAETNDIMYTKYGEIAYRQLFLLEERYSHLKIDNYVIMPNHIHMVLILNYETAGVTPRPTIMDIVCAYKSLTTRECKRNGFSVKLFQTSFHEHIIRNKNDYNEISNYIRENPLHWYYDELYSEH